MRRAAHFLLLSLSICAFSQTADERLPEFEVASVKPIDPNGRNAIDIKVFPGGRMLATGATLQQLAAAAYGGLQLYQVSGSPWTNDARFNIEAKPPENDFGQQPTVLALGRTVPLQTMLRLRALLISRFNLKTHFEMKEHVVYDLVVAKNGPRLAEGRPEDPDSGFCGGYRVTTGIEAKGCSMPWLASLLSRMIFETDVFDKTGLTGLYTFNVDFAPMGRFAPVNADAEPPAAPSLFEAIQSAGLKLETRKGEVKVLVIDHAEKPSGN